MDFLLNIFSEKLSKFIIGFRKEQVTASLLTGKGEITDIHVNVEPLNAILKETTPFIELSSVYVSKLGFNVSSFTNLKKKPIEVSIDEVHVLLVEPLSFKKRNWSWDKWSKKIVADALKRGSYGLLDRIGDNITLEVNRAYITLQPMGSFKTRRIGPWTPPAISIALNHFKYVSVDEFGQEGPNSAIWRHTSRNAKGSNNSEPSKRFVDEERILRHGTLIIFKKVSMECSVSIGYMKEGMNVKENFMSSVELLQNVPVEVQIALHRRLSNASILAVQVDVSLQNIEIDIETGFLPTLIHAALGVNYCLAKDRSFTDPLVCDEKQNNTPRKKIAPIVKLVEQEAEVEQTEINVEEIDLQDDDSVSEVESEENDITPHDCENDNSNISSIERKPSSRITGILPNSLRMKNKKVADKPEDWPAIIMPYGLLIFEKICVSLSVHSVGLRLRHESDVETHIQLTMKGLVSEIIWPQLKSQQGGIVQLSLAYFCLQECTGKSLRTLLIGGTEHDWFKTLHNNETTFEEFFPLLEPRPVRKDPFDYRGSFPMQAFGFKAFIRITKEAQSTSLEDRIFVLNEVGINGIEIIFDSDRWERLFSLYSPNGDRKYDNRWFSGDWSNHITKVMLISPTTFNVKECIQPPKEKGFEKKQQTSDLINLTAKLSSVSIRIPAPLHKDTESSDVCISFSESMLLISSALPRNFLSDNIPGESGVNSEDSKTDDSPNMRFPNGSSDPSNDIQISTERNIRTQISLTNFSIKAMPPISFHKSKETLTLISSSKLTLLLSLEQGQEIENSSTSLFFTALLLDVKINIEFGVLSSIASSILHHMEQLNQALAPYIPLSVIDDEKKQSNITIITRLSVPNLDLFLWRRIFYGGSSQVTCDVNRKNYMQMLLLMHLRMEDINLGLQMVYHDSTNKFQMKENDIDQHKVLKASVGKMDLSLCNSDLLMEQRNKIDRKQSIIGTEDNCHDCFKECVNIICFEKGKSTPQPSGSSENNIVFAMRVESRTSPSGTCDSAAVDISSGKIVLKMETIDSFITLTTEAIYEQISQLSTSKKIETWRNNSFVMKIMENLSTVFSDKRTENVVNTTLQEKVNSLFSASADSTFMRMCVENVVLAVPQSAMDKTYFGLIFEATSVCAAFFQGKGLSTYEKLMLEASSGPDGLPWRQIFSNISDGFHHTISSRQNCVNMDGRQGRNSGAETLIESFSVESNGQPLKWQGLLDTCTLSIHDISILDKLSSCLKICSKYSTHIKSEVSSMLSALAVIPFTDHATRETPKTVARNIGTSPLTAICEASSNSMRSMALLFAQMKEELATLGNKNRLCLEAKQNEIDKLRRIIFEKERERFSVGSLISNQACGFIRMGGTGLCGQRTVSVTNLWKYWAVLRDSHLIIFKNFSELIPLDYVNLQGAKLRALAGGGRKRDLMQGFVIIDSCGIKRFFLAMSNKEYQMWINSLSIVINHVCGKDTLVKTKSIENKLSENQSSQQSMNGRNAVIAEEGSSSHGGALGIQSQNDNSTLKAPPLTIDLQGTPLPNNSESKKKVVNVGLGSTARSQGQKISDQPENDIANPRQATSSQDTESNDLGSNQDKLISREDDSVSCESFNMDEGAEGSPKNQSKLRQRMSKLGSVVKKVKISGRNTTHDSGSNHGPDLISVEDNASNESSILDEGAEGSPKHQSKLRQRMSKLGSVVKKVKITDRNTHIDPESNHDTDLISVEEDNASNESLILDEGAEGNPKRQSKLRQRMSKLGSAVKKVKITDRNTLFPNLPSGRKGDSNDVELNHSRHLNGLAEKPVKMKSLRPDVHQPPTKTLLISKKSSITRRVTGVWSAQVSHDVESKLDPVPSLLSHSDDTSEAINQTKKSDTPSKSQKNFVINSTCLQHESKNASKVTVVKTLSDIIEFHSAISETLYSTDHSLVAVHLNLAEDMVYREALKNHVMICGNILQGLLEYPDRNEEYLVQYVCDSLAALIGCMLSNSLPESAYDIVVEFLSLRNSINLMALGEGVNHLQDDASQSTTEGKTLPSDCMHLIQNCEYEMIKSNYQLTKLKTIASMRDSSHSFTETPTVTPSNSVLSRAVYNEAIQEALAAVMAERDEAHVQLVASRVIHSHEMEQERKKVLILSEKVEQFENVWNDDSAAAAKFFLGQQKPAVRESMGDIEKEMVQNSDDELIALCKQLSSEISSRVTAELEILSLKERHKIEHDAEISEQAALREEVQHYKKQLQEEVLRRQSAEDEKKRWEESFQQLINNPDAPVK